MNELELTKNAITGNREAFCDLYEMYRVRLYRYAYYRLSDRDDAEDAVSSCILSAWEQIRKLREPEAFCAWIFRLLRGACSRIIKEQMDRKKTIPLDMAGGTGMSDSQDDGRTEVAVSSGIADGISASAAGAADMEGHLRGGEKAVDPETSAILMEALGLVDEQTREMVLLSAVGRLTSKDIGEMYEMPEGTVRSRLSRSFAAMRKLMEAGNE